MGISSTVFLDARVLQRIGERSSTHTAEQFSLRYSVSPCMNWSHYEATAHDMGVPIPGGGGVFDDEAESSSEEEREEESETEELPFRRVSDAALAPFFQTLCMRVLTVCWTPAIFKIEQCLFPDIMCWCSLAVSKLPPCIIGRNIWVNS